jgi:hypothetical protein
MSNWAGRSATPVRRPSTATQQRRHREKRTIARIDQLAARPIQQAGATMHITEVVDGREVTSTSNTKPKTGSHEVVR